MNHDDGRNKNMNKVKQILKLVQQNTDTRGTKNLFMRNKVKHIRNKSRLLPDKSLDGWNTNLSLTKQRSNHMKQNKNNGKT